LNLSPAQVRNWIRKELPRPVASGGVDRPEQTACALVIEDVFRRYPEAWGAICQLGAATERDGNADFKKWEMLVEKMTKYLWLK